MEEVPATSNIGAEFSDSKKKIDFLREKASASVKNLTENIKVLKSKFTNGIYKQTLEQFQKMKSIEQARGRI